MTATRGRLASARILSLTPGAVAHTFTSGPTGREATEERLGDEPARGSPGGAMRERPGLLGHFVFGPAAAPVQELRSTAERATPTSTGRRPSSSTLSSSLTASSMSASALPRTTRMYDSRSPG